MFCSVFFAGVGQLSEEKPKYHKTNKETFEGPRKPPVNGHSFSVTNSTCGVEHDLLSPDAPPSGGSVYRSTAKQKTKKTRTVSNGKLLETVWFCFCLLTCLCCGTPRGDLSIIHPDKSDWVLYGFFKNFHERHMKQYTSTYHFSPGNMLSVTRDAQHALGH